MSKSSSTGTLPDSPEHRELQLAAAIAIAYVEHNTLPAESVPDLVWALRVALARPLPADAPREERLRPTARATPAVPIAQSITPDYLVSLEDGKPYRSLRRHLMAKYGLTPDDYRRRWGLPADYPMVAPNYAVQRSEVAKRIGLGRIRRGSGSKGGKR